MKHGFCNCLTYWKKNVCPIRFLEDHGMSTLISLPSEDSGEAGSRSPS